jgi:hypothetical protein
MAKMVLLLPPLLLPLLLLLLSLSLLLPLSLSLSLSLLLKNLPFFHVQTLLVLPVDWRTSLAAQSRPNAEKGSAILNTLQKLLTCSITSQHIPVNTRGTEITNQNCRMTNFFHEFI